MRKEDGGPRFWINRRTLVGCCCLSCQPELVECKPDSYAYFAFQENAILWVKRLKDNDNKAKTKKAMAPMIARFGNTQPPRGLKGTKSRWHNLRSSVLRYIKKRKEDPEYKVKWTFWGDLEFLRSSLELTEANEDQGEWSSEEIGKPCTLLFFYFFPIFVVAQMPPWIQ